MIKLRDIEQLEIIDAHGRAFGRYDLDGVAMSGQDDGRTLKLFLDHEGEPDTRTTTVLMAALHMLENGDVEGATKAMEGHLNEIMEDDDG